MASRRDYCPKRRITIRKPAYERGQGEVWWENERAGEQILASTMPENLISNAIGGFPLFAGALALTLGAASTGSEYGWGTLQTVLVQRPQRLSFFAGELLAQ